ncbi:hypothetical protein GCM10027046_21920 [Uliginosibacterium flavum]|uniref:Uncharacterized protein n=1 Tax=Uliginosibacterium flavum TaxID=1396831 RepID=A0ABV2TLU2_9RHOO
MRVFLVVGAWMLGVLAVLALAGFILWSNYGREYVDAIQTAAQEGAAIGKSKDDGSCYALTLDKLKACDSFKCTLETKTFASSCFRSTRVQTGFCEDVPRISNVVKYLSWLGDTCEEAAPDNDNCGKVLEEVVKYCSSRSH